MGLCSHHVSGDPRLGWGQIMPRQRRQQPSEDALKCPRCGSGDTKFCYYNNYNRSQPRHFCKSCKRHWTKGGTLRNIPVGGSRKNKRPKVLNRSTTVPATSRKYGSNYDNQKSMANILHHALIRSSSPSLSLPQHPPPEFEFSSGLGTVLETNGYLTIPTCFQTVSLWDPMGESMTVASSIEANASSSSTAPWPSPDASSVLDLSDYWSWNEIDALSSADLKAAWGDGGIQDNGKIEPDNQVARNYQ